MLAPMRLLAFVGILCACDATLDGVPASSDGGTFDGGAAMADAGSSREEGIAPTDAVIGEIPGADGDSVVFDGDVVRVDVLPSEHVTFFLTFDRTSAPVVLEVLRWDGEEAVSLGLTDAGLGLRTLAVFDPSGPRTFWARISTQDDSALDATLAITRAPFEDGIICAADCARLMQLPLPNDPSRDGYAITPSTILRYQYGRRDLLMFLRYAGRTVVAHGLAPFLPQDLSQWNGETPGTDVGAPRHVSHQRGKDVDISLYGLDGRSEWRSYCVPQYTVDGRECVPGSIMNYGDAANALFFGAFFASDRVTMCFLDRELINPTIDAAESAETIDAALVPLYSDGQHLQHWPNHDNHIHIRVSEEEAGTFSLTAFEPP